MPSQTEISDVSAGIFFLHIEYTLYTTHGVILGIRLGIQLHKYPVSVQVTSPSWYAAAWHATAAPEGPVSEWQEVEESHRRVM